MQSILYEKYVAALPHKNYKAAEVIHLAKSYQGGLYEDPEFPASESSLFSDPHHPQHPASYVTSWKRPSEIHSNPVLFKQDISPADICQGYLGDCWFLGALGAVAHHNRGSIISELVVSSHPEAGFYQFRFWKTGWVTVTVDDRIPIGRDGKTPIYARSAGGDEFWVSLMEKAYAKLHGSYQALEGGDIGYALVDLTGGTDESIDFDDLKSSGKLFSFINHCVIDEDWLLGTSLHTTSGELEGDNGNGILMQHAYSVLDVHTLNRDTLICLRNPWGKTEWRGRWSDSDTQSWTEENQRALNYTLKDDGEFWMSEQDYANNYNNLSVCRLLEEEKMMKSGHIWYRTLLNGSWSNNNSTAGGCVNNSTWVQNPQYRIKSKGQNGSVFVMLHQVDTRVTGVRANCIGLVVAKDDGDVQGGKKTQLSQEDVVTMPSFQTSREVSAEFEIGPESGTYVLIPQTFQPGVEGYFTIRVFSQNPIEVFEVEGDGQEVLENTVQDPTLSPEPTDGTDDGSGSGSSSGVPSGNGGGGDDDNDNSSSSNNDGVQCEIAKNDASKEISDKDLKKYGHPALRKQRIQIDDVPDILRKHQSVIHGSKRNKSEITRTVRSSKGGYSVSYTTTTTTSVSSSSTHHHTSIHYHIEG